MSWSKFLASLAFRLETRPSLPDHAGQRVLRDVVGARAREDELVRHHPADLGHERADGVALGLGPLPGVLVVLREEKQQVSCTVLVKAPFYFIEVEERKNISGLKIICQCLQKEKKGNY